MLKRVKHKVINLVIILIFLFSLIPIYAQEEREEIIPPTPSGEEGQIILGEKELAEIDQVLEETAPAEVGITPDEFPYGLKIAIERIRLALTFNRAKRAEFALRLAENRLEEAALMARLNKLEALERAKDEHTRLIQRARLEIEEIDEEDLETQVELESKVKENQDKIEEIKSLVLIKARGLTEEQQQRLFSLIEEFKQNNQEISVRIINKGNVIKTRLEARGLREDEIKLRIKERVELLEANLERNAQHQIDQATKMLELASTLIEKAETEKNVTIRQVTLDLKAKAEEKLNEANTALSNTEFRLAIELSRLSKKLSALTIASIRGISEEKIDEELEDLLEEEQEIEEELEEEEEENEIEVEVEDNRAKVKIEVSGVKAKFILLTTNRGEIIDEIVTRTGLSREEVESIITFEFEEEEEDVREILRERVKLRIERAEERLKEARERVREAEETLDETFEELEEESEEEGELEAVVSDLRESRSGKNSGSNGGY